MFKSMFLETLCLIKFIFIIMQIIFEFHNLAKKKQEPASSCKKVDYFQKRQNSTFLNLK